MFKLIALVASAAAAKTAALISPKVQDSIADVQREFAKDSIKDNYEKLMQDGNGTRGNYTVY